MEQEVIEREPEGEDTDDKQPNPFALRRKEREERDRDPDVMGKEVVVESRRMEGRGRGFPCCGAV
jgi:hypothetical protein